MQRERGGGKKEDEVVMTKSNEKHLIKYSVKCMEINKRKAIRTWATVGGDRGKQKTKSIKKH